MEWKKWPDEQPERIQDWRLDGTPGGGVSGDLLVVVKAKDGLEFLLIASYAFEDKQWYASEMPMDGSAGYDGRAIEDYTVVCWAQLPLLPTPE
jgi:hypothetical protein